MCTIDVYPGGERKRHRCSHYRRREPCQEAIYHHTTPAPIAIPHSSNAYHHLPPSPRLTPGSSPMVGSYHSSPRPSHHESDSDSSHRRRRRQPRPTVYVNGEPVTPREPSASSHRRGSSSSSHRRYETGSRGERIVIIENPPTPRSPPQQHSIPRTAPSSPSPLQTAFRNQPVIVDDRDKPARRVRISVPPSPEVSEGSSSGSGGRRVRVRRAEPEPEPERQRHRGAADEEARRRERDARIERANRHIAGRPERPMPYRPEPSAPRRASTAYVRPTVEIPPVSGVGLGVGTAGVTAGMRGLRVEDEEDEDEAQQQRLRERMMPKRRASVGPASRRHREQYGDGITRLE